MVAINHNFRNTNCIQPMIYLVFWPSIYQQIEKKINETIVLWVIVNTALLFIKLSANEGK